MWLCALIFFARYDRIEEKTKGITVMTYIVTKIEGDYATLTEEGSGEELFIALALLPIGVDIGTKLLYENFEFSIV